MVGIGWEFVAAEKPRSQKQDLGHPDLWLSGMLVGADLWLMDGLATGSWARISR
jgi:hypothetical protein